MNQEEIKKNFPLIASVTAAAMACVALGLIVFSKQPMNFQGSYINSFGSATSTAVNVTSTSATAVLSGVNANRYYALITNKGGSNVALSFNSTSTGVTFASGTLLVANGGALEINLNNLYTGQIYAITQSGSTSTLGVIER